MSAEVRTVEMTIVPELLAYLEWIEEEGREFDHDDYGVFLAGRRSVSAPEMAEGGQE